MKKRLLGCLILAIVALSASAFIGKGDGDTPHENTVQLFEKALPKMDGQTLTLHVTEVHYAPGEGTPPHEHPGPTFAYVIEGSVVSQLEGEPAKTYHQGEFFYEAPHQKHLVSKNASTTAPAKLLAYNLVEGNQPVKTMLQPDSH